MKNTKNKTTAILIAVFLTLSMAASTTLIPSAHAHTPRWNIPTYAYINASPNPTGVNQTLIIYIWLDCVYGAAGYYIPYGATTPAVPGNFSTAQAAALANDYRFRNYELTITNPKGTLEEVTFPVVSDPTSSQYYYFTPTMVGTYILNFTFPGQVYGANGDGYEQAPIFGDYYEPSNASTTLTVQSTQIPPVVTTEPLPTSYWQEPIYGENSNWYAVSSNWLGLGSAVPAGYTSTPLYHGDAIGPLTSHVMWTQPIQNGGIVGGNMFPDNTGADYFEGSSYAARFYNPIIINGYLYYTVVASFTGQPLMSGSATGPTVCVNLRTGQQLWSNMNIPELSFGYIYDLNDPDQHGTYPPILVAAVGGYGTPFPATWELFDGFTGDSLFNVTNVPYGVAAAGPRGEQLIYSFTDIAPYGAPAEWYLSEWNMSKLWQYDTDPYTGDGSLSPSIVLNNGLLLDEGPNADGGQLPIPITGEEGEFLNGTTVWVPYGSTLTVNANIPRNSNEYAAGTTTPIKDINDDSLTTYDWNISVPWFNTQTFAPTVVAVNYGEAMLCENGTLPTGFAGISPGELGGQDAPYTMFLVNLNASVAPIGSILWMKNYPAPAGNITLQDCDVDWQTGVFVYNYYETMQWVGFSLKDGSQIWGPTPSEVAFNYYDATGYDDGVMAYGNLYNGGFGGVTYCFNDATGQLKWTWGNGPPGSSNSTYAGSATPYGVYPTFIQSIANGIVYLATDEHTVPNPIYPGARLTAINATTGKEIWSLSGYPSEWATSGSDFVVADGYLTFFNGYDGQIYVVGRGPSQTTVTAPDTGLTFGQPVVMRGTVMDISAGTTETEQTADFPNGVPCCSDASMTAWMGYVYQQQPKPTNFAGVPVTISVTDSNHNTYVIGTATTNENGMYTLTWTPIVQGNFTVTATFAGTNGYWPSSDTTSFNVMQPAPTASPYPSPVTGLASTGTVELGIAVVVIVIVIIGALIMLMLRKRP